MNTDAVEMILSKLGTTMDQLIPSITSYKEYKCLLDIKICCCLFVLGVLLITLAIYLYNKDSIEGEWAEWVVVGASIIGPVIVCVCIIGISINFVELHMWSKQPTIKAYETLLRWIGGNG